MVLITDKKSSDAADVLTQGEIIRKSGIPIISLYVSREIDGTELNNISGGNKNVVENFRMGEFWDQVAAAVATQPLAIESNRTFSGSLLNSHSTSYLQIQKSKNSNIKFNLNRL